MNPRSQPRPDRRELLPACGIAVAIGASLLLAGPANASVLKDIPFGLWNLAQPDGLFGLPGNKSLPEFPDDELPPGYAKPDYRSHSDVPDLPDSNGDDTESDPHSAIYQGDPYPGIPWYPGDQGFGFELEQVFTLDHSNLVAPTVTPSAVPAPGGIGLLTVLTAAVVARRRR